MNNPEKLLADFLTQDEAAAEMKISERTLDRWRRLGEGPPITKLGKRVLYRRASVQRWLAGQEYHAHATDGSAAKSSARARV